ncbi:hypothetical protein ACWC9T_31040 [Kitasatospora sp. NPDC001159]|uniref:Uncharacterized protein n=1 Tax=Streptomyces kaniharaensis TaxID=212423 RepID=A0A6N7KX05_9ACTN|nr:hypothetical protein [Streptomyces kaniharaensis]MQS16206.1 hypothetical protein [Streptomyces kaniharaensis]
MTAEVLPVELLLRNLKFRPSMFFLDGSFAQYVAFFSGFGVSSEAAEVPFLDGFAEWIAAHARSGHNLTWPTLVLRSIWPEWNGSVSDWSKLDSISDKHAVRVLFELLAAFKGIDPGVLGLATDGTP